jgi:hypothetical protein
MWAALLFVCLRASAAPAPVDEEAPWPRVRSTNGHTVTLHLPQVERWTSNSFTARAAVEVKRAKEKEIVGVIWLDAHGVVDHSNRMVLLERFEIVRSSFAAPPAQVSNALAVIRDVLPAGARTISLDYLITALGFVQAAARQGPSGLKHDSPRILWVTNRSVLILIDGEPVFRPIPESSLERVVNTPALIVHDKPNARFYLSGAGQWFASADVKGPWGPVQSPPSHIASLAPTNVAAPGSQPAPKIIVSTSPAELLMTSGLPDYRRIPGTGLQYIADTDNLVFFDSTNREVYVLFSGRWFKAKSLHGPWTHVPPRDLPTDFARIPSGTPQAIALASVPGTPQSSLALLANSAPTTATVNRRTTTIQLTYDGEPKFKSIKGTSMSYAANAQLPVIQTGTNFFALDNGVWFTAPAAKGPWQVATEVPDEIYTIPPNSPVYYATYARVYQSTDDEVEVGYTAGYLGAFEDDGTVVYGTGWDYEYWYEDEYYGWGSTWGWSYVYVPWYQWWLWRPWWNEQGGLRAAIIENVYDRWAGRNGVSHHDPSRRSSGTLLNTSSGYPAQYGRFRGSTRAAELAPPANTLAVNPFSRPKAPLRPGDVPHGAQLLTRVSQQPGGGRDLYASHDGNVYLRRDDAWYRREGNGGWSFHAPTQTSVDRTRAGSTTRAQQSAAPRNMDRSFGAHSTRPGDDFGRGDRDRISDVDRQARAQELASIEREYYARSLAQMRSQNVRAGRPARSGARRR